MADRLFEDLGNHFATRLRLLLEDTAGTCRHGGMERLDIAKLLLAGLIGETATGAYSIRLTDEQYLEACWYALQSVRKHNAGKHKKKRPAGARG